MIKLFSGRYQRHVAWFLFFVFYGELAVCLYATRGTVSQINYTWPVRQTRLPDWPAGKLSPVVNITSPAPVSENRIELIDETIPLPGDIASAPASIDEADKTFIGGPGQPEMSTFKSVSSDNMVNLFTGDFSYNIPLGEVGGFPLNIFYNAGADMSQESSWVGLGWNLNPGTISRNMRGLPDDYSESDSITKTQSMRPDRTIGVSGSATLELVGLPPGLDVGLNAGIFYNNKRGLGLIAGGKLDYQVMKHMTKTSKTEKGVDTVRTEGIKLNGSVSLNSQNGMTFDGGFQYERENITKRNEWGISTSISGSTRTGISDVQISGEFKDYKSKMLNKLGQPLRLSPNLDFARSSFTPSIRVPVTVSNYTYHGKFGKTGWGLFKNGYVSGYVQESRIADNDKTQKKPAFGFMYYERGNKNSDALLDFNRLNDGVVTIKRPVISLPVYTYDVFTISGEGTGGSFRGYRGNIGYMRDHETSSKSTQMKLSMELGVKNILHAGVNIGGVFSPSFVREWKSSNTLGYSTAFNKTDSIYQTAYFKNPAEKAIIDQNYYAALGGDQLIRPYLGNTNAATPMLRSAYQVYNDNMEVDRTLGITAANSHRAERDKRTQVITWFTAKEADEVGLDKYIYSYDENDFNPGFCDTTGRTKIARYDYNNHRSYYRKRDHMSKVEVVEGSGQRYIYGIPAYQIKQKQVTFSVNELSTPDDQGLVGYTAGTDNTVRNDQGRDGFFQSELMDGYAHSFLLTSVLSPDYVDIKGDGITDDDHGTAVKFNYSRVDKQAVDDGNTWEPYRWRTPVADATFNEGLKADKRDNKGLYTYGEKELWYLHSIESKNMVATFHTSKREDGYPVNNENGGLNTADGVRQLRKLDSISIYTKAEFLSHPDGGARPIKRIYFYYSYKLCKSYALNKNSAGSASGKLTLDGIAFGYNGNLKQRKNKYAFKYSATNPDHSLVSTDRWGVYKPHTENPQDMSNEDYPYTLQNKTLSDQYASAWNLDSILLPSGALMTINYEADDYGYVQDKRASQMTNIVGFADNIEGNNVSNKLYTWNSAFEGIDVPKMDHRYVYFDAGAPVTLAQVKQRYMQDIKQLLLKLWVKMPRGNIGADVAYEPIVVYGVVKDCFLDDENPNRFIIELAETRKGGSPIMETVMQFLKDNLPARAYPGYEVNGNGALLQVVNAVWGLVNAFTQGVLGFERDLKYKGKCKEVDLSRSFARLNNPERKKIGGGYRVKKITVNDNWKTMAGASAHDATYGQLYEYTTTEEIGGEQVTISSGVASYEPGIGNEENPFREVLKYDDRQFLGPTDHNNVELPVAETFFPSPVVGYSKVKVKSIHNKETKGKNIKSAVGMQETEYYTTRDFPVIAEFTSFDHDSRKHHTPQVLQRIFNFDKRDYLTITQGFRIVLNDMNGKMKSQTSYAENDLLNPIHYTAHHYRLIPKGNDRFKLDNLLPVIGSADGVVTNKIIGKDIEVMNDFREHFSYTSAMNLPLNANLFKIGTLPVLLPGIFKLFFRDESMYRAATTLKVVNEYGIIDSMVVIDKGSVVGTKNLVYDAETGNPLLTRTNNAFNKPVYSFSYPAWWTQTGMEPAYRNIDLTYPNVLFRNGRIEESPHVNMDHFESGDEIYVLHNGVGPRESIGCTTAGYPNFLPGSEDNLVWAVDIRKDPRNAAVLGNKKEFIFLDRIGKPFNAINATIRVIRSGKRNHINASVGSIVSLKNPLRMRGGVERIIIDDTTDVINASAAEFNENWRSNDIFYTKDTIIRTVRKVPIYTKTVFKTDSHQFGVYGRGGPRNHDNIPNPIDFSADQYDKGNRDLRVNSWLLFNFVGFSATDVIVSAKLRLKAHITPEHSYWIHQNGQTADCPDQVPAYGPLETHSYTNPHVSTVNHTNDFYLTRMMSNWPADNNCPAWQGIYESSVPQSGMNRMPFSGTSSPSAVNRDLEIAPLVTGMLRDKFDVSKNYATGLRIDLINNGSTNSRMCFWARNDTTYVKPFFTEPYIDVQHYRCDDPAGDTIFHGPIDDDTTVAPPGYALCPTDAVSKICLSRFDQHQMNPYIESVIGNFRAHRSYVYYGARREEDPTAATDIRKDGVIKEYESYWSFASNAKGKLGKTGSSKWVWNSEITQYNRKGAELENHDPLNRYNCGIYGYQETLPVAVASNSRLRLSAFDGFEDYGYKDEPCEFFCKPYRRHFNTGSPMLTNEESHTGLYSVVIPESTNYHITVPVSVNDSIDRPDLLIELDSTAHNVLQVFPKGVGLQGTYFDNSSFNGPFQVVQQDEVNLSFAHKKNSDDCNGSTSQHPPSGSECRHMSVRWRGYIQVTESGYYEFKIDQTDDRGYVVIIDNPADPYPSCSPNYPECTPWSTKFIWGGADVKSPVYMSKGRHRIEVTFQQFTGQGDIFLTWKTPGSTRFVPLPKQYLYPLGQESLMDGTEITDTVYCVKPDTIQAINHQFVDTLNLIPGRKMVASVWMKKGGQDCKCSGYTHNYRILTPGNVEVATFVAKERIIEGWQQFEAVFTVPDVASLKFDFPGLSDADTYIDDLRIHPFNANMKSFVYDPVTLRLSAELDENNFATFYEYDDDGGLIRVKKETRQGIKTITETRSATQQKIKL